MSLDDLKTQGPVISLLKGALEKRRLPHGLLFQGLYGAGQNEAALELAKVLFCENSSHFDSCGLCVHCRQITQGTHPDLVRIEAEKDSQGISVEAIREIISKSNLRPFQAQAKVFIINEAHLMNEVAQNALLKTLEEPEGNTYFILITQSPKGLLETIRSRVQSFHFLPVPSDSAQDPEIEEAKKDAVRFIFSSDGQTPPDLARFDRRTLAAILEHLCAYFRELLLLRVGAEDVLGFIQDAQTKESRARQYSNEDLSKNIELIGQAKEKILQNMNIKLVVSILWDSLEKSNA